MTGTLPDLSSNREFDDLAAVVDAVERASASAGVRPRFVGAKALELHLRAFGLVPGRRTNDVDFAVEVSDWSQFERLRAADSALIASRFPPGRGVTRASR